MVNNPEKQLNPFEKMIQEKKKKEEEERAKKGTMPQKSNPISANKPSQVAKPVSQPAPPKVDTRPVFNANKPDTVSDKPGQKLQNQFNQALKTQI